MLRAFVIGLGALFVLGGAALAAVAPKVWPVSVELFVFGVLILVGLFFERHYRGRSARASGNSTPTGERFIDPTTGKLTEVLYNAQTGERTYRQM